MYQSTFSLVAFAFISTIINNVLPVLAIPKISAVGNKFFTEDGDQFYIKGRRWLNLSRAPLLKSFLGIAYQLIPLDPLIDEAQCKRDAKLMKDLNANAIRVYHVDPTADHSGCMTAFADVGIYLFVDLDTFDTQLEQVSHHQPVSSQLRPRLSAYVIFMAGNPRVEQVFVHRIQSSSRRVSAI